MVLNFFICLNNMKDLVNFFHQVGKLKDKPRKGWVINEIESPESIADHAFRAALMAWILGSKKRLNIERVLKTALIHDLCKVYAPDVTPYDSILPKDPAKRREMLKTWPKISEKGKKIVKENKYKKEKAALEKLTSDLPRALGGEIRHLWFDYEKGLTKEGRFLKQADHLENLLQAMEYHRKCKNPPQGPWWKWAKEFFDDPISIEFVEEIAKKFHHNI